MGNSHQDSDLEFSGYPILQTAAVDAKEILKTSLSTESFESQTGLCFLNAGIPAQVCIASSRGMGPMDKQFFVSVYVYKEFKQNTREEIRCCAFHLPTRSPRVGSRGCFSISWVGS